MPNYTAKAQDKKTQYGWKNHEDDPMEQMRRSLLAKDDQINQLKRTIPVSYTHLTLPTIYSV